MTMPPHFEKPNDLSHEQGPDRDRIAVPWACHDDENAPPVPHSYAAMPEGGSAASESGLTSDRRGQERYLTVMRAARLSSRVHQVEGLGVVRNISEGGMMIDAHQNFSVGELIAVSLLDGDRVQGEVVWKDGNTIGVKFASWMTIDHLLAKPRTDEAGLRVRPPRLAVSRKAVIRIGGYMADMELCDISQRGAKICFRQNLAIDSRVQISLGALRPVSASVKWQVDQLIGIEFHRTLSPEELAGWLNGDGNNSSKAPDD
ncbi:PilZ domain-containing protein [Sphingorhabdus contaminans]|uniref:PilZ domain-containing protein n=1 Tax=Sphingorhabdus contaminans TaxID=1343899 RepID=A0A553WA94_9SPHN|nr:PilZ domain-containing protein [Sphingorhabdus contaminans]TSB01592.1 PilZ domain-containing protein [Sphingorhabdus contaminans]